MEVQCRPWQEKHSGYNRAGNDSQEMRGLKL